MIFDFSQPTQIVFLIIDSVILLWLVVITFIFFSLKKHYNQLTNKTDKKNLQSILEEILKHQTAQTKSLDKLQNEIKSLENDGKYHLQNIGFLRFNPFADTGGDQSFTLALLDDHKNGVVFSSLHNREMTRVYAKQIVKGKGKDFPLSDEESKVVSSAQIIKS